MRKRQCSPEIGERGQNEKSYISGVWNESHDLIRIDQNVNQQHICDKIGNSEAQLENPENEHRNITTDQCFHSNRFEWYARKIAIIIQWGKYSFQDNENLDEALSLKEEIWRTRGHPQTPQWKRDAMLTARCENMPEAIKKIWKWNDYENIQVVKQISRGETYISSMMKRSSSLANPSLLSKPSIMKSAGK